MTLIYQPGDLIFFYGTGFLSSAIRLFAGGGPSHCAMLIDPSTVSDGGAGLRGPYIAESTIRQGQDGVQINSLPLRIASYDKGGSIAICRRDQRIPLDFAKMWELLYLRVGRDHYEKIALAEYVARWVPLLHYVPAYNNPHREDCSDLVTMLLAAGRLPGLNPFLTTPKTLFEMKMFAGIEWLAGKPRDVDKFNSR
jgi:hypothetical protein